MFQKGVPRHPNSGRRKGTPNKPKIPPRLCSWNGCCAKIRKDSKTGICQNCYGKTPQGKQWRKEWVRKRKEADPAWAVAVQEYNTRHAREHRRASPENRVRYLLVGARRRAAEKGVPFGIALDDLLPLPQRCPILGLPLAYDGSGGFGANPNAASLDRIVPGKGYVVGNVRIISWRANHIKTDASPDELIKVATDARCLKMMLNSRRLELPSLPLFSGQTHSSDAASDQLEAAKVALA
jgi:hypothetical protein